MEIKLDDLMKKYKLSSEENKEIGNKICEIMMQGKSTSENPIAIIDIGPPGSGKTGLNGYALKQFRDNNLIIVNNDELRPFHPKADEIACLYPQFYTKVTNEESKIWTDSLMDRAIEGKYNVLYEGTGRKIEIFSKMISKMKNEGYKIIVRAMAVNELNCLMSILERYEGQVRKKGWGRIVALDTFYKAYDDEMLNTVDTFEKTRMVDSVEVYLRGVTPTEVVRIYSNNNREFASAKTAIITGRERDKRTANRKFEEDFSKCLFASGKSFEEIAIIEKLNSLYYAEKTNDDEIIK